MTIAALTDNARRVLEARYLRRDPRGEIVETPDELFRRVAVAVAAAEERWDAQAAPVWEERFFDLLAGLDFLPNSPTLMNAGMPLGQLSACFVLPVEDDMVAIFDSLKMMALIQQSGGGTGFSFSRLRPRGDRVASTGGQASGPVSFMRIFDCATENIRQGGRRRGANMGILRVDHPDIEEFVNVKRDGVSFQNFNLSVAATDAFLEAATNGRPLELRNPRTGAVVDATSAAALIAEIAEAAWQTGDPGMVFIDAINRANPTPSLGPIEATNPCGEVPLLPYEACTLGSINLSRMVRREGDGMAVDWARLADTVRLGIRFLDDVVEISRWPDPRIEAAVRRSRKIGLGVMGWAEMLILLGVPYASEPALATAEELMRFIAEQAATASEELARQRGVFPTWEQSIHRQSGRRLRNATRTSIAPTGTIGILAGTSAGIEPLFALAYFRRALDGQAFWELNPLFVRYAEQRGFLSDAILHQLERHGSLARVPEAPQEPKRLFQTALDISPEWHLRMQWAFQRHVDNAVSKTINLPASASAEEIAAIYRQAWELGLKGVTVFRYGSKAQQVLTLGKDETPQFREHFARCDPHACRL